MALSPTEAALVRESFDRLEADLASHSAEFYDAFFRHAPQLRSMFRDDLTGQGMKFMRTLRNIIRHVQGSDEYADTLSELGREHAMLGVMADHFPPMEEALIETLHGALGGTFTQAHEAAWRHAFSDISGRMIHEGKTG